MNTILEELKNEIKKNYGKKCKDYNPFCAGCIMWGAYDTIKEGINLCKK